MDIKCDVILEAYAELKAIAPKDEYVSLDYIMNRYSNGREDIECSVYIGSAGEFVADTFKLALKEAKQKLELIKKRG